MVGICLTTGERVHGELVAHVLERGTVSSTVRLCINERDVGGVEVEHRVGRHFIGEKSTHLLNNQAHGFCLDADVELAVHTAMAAR